MAVHDSLFFHYHYHTIATTSTTTTRLPISLSAYTTTTTSANNNASDITSGSMAVIYIVPFLFHMDVQHMSLHRFVHPWWWCHTDTVYTVAKVSSKPAHASTIAALAYPCEHKVSCDQCIRPCLVTTCRAPGDHRRDRAMPDLAYPCVHKARPGLPVRAQGKLRTQ